MRRIGYVRVSTHEQNLDLQIRALKEAGCQEIFQDKISGSKKSRSGLDAMMAFAEKGDCIIVWRLDRLGRSLIDLVSIVNSFNDRGIGFKSLSDNIVDTSSPSGEMVFGLFAVLAQYERKLIQERTQAGLVAARAKGNVGGRPPLDPADPKIKVAKSLHRAGDMRVSEICKQQGWSRSQYYRYLKVDL